MTRTPFGQGYLGAVDDNQAVMMAQNQMISRQNGILQGRTAGLWLGLAAGITALAVWGPKAGFLAPFAPVVGSIAGGMIGAIGR